MADDIEKVSSEKPVRTTEKCVENDNTEDQANLQGFSLVSVVLSMMLVVFATEMDRTIISTAVPKLTTEFGTLDAVAWYGGAYLLVFSSFLPLLGQLYRKFQSNLRSIFLISLLIFEIGSTICATAKSSLAFILGRASAGLGGAGVIVGGLCIIGDAVPIRRRALLYSIINSVKGIAVLAGPPLGGVFTESPKLTWRWCFWINLPIGALAMFSFAIVYKPRPKIEEKDCSVLQKLLSMDIAGSFLILAAMVSLLLALQWGGTTYSWRDPKVWSLFLVFVVLISGFGAVQYVRGDRAVFPLRILKTRTTIACALVSLLIQMGQYVHIYFLPIYFQSSRNLSARTSGLFLVVYLLSNTLASIATGVAVTAIGRYKPIIVCGAGLFSIGSGVLYVLRDHYGVWIWLVGQLLAGSGTGMVFALIAVALQAVFPPQDLATVNTIAVFFINLGGVLGSNFGQVVFLNSLIARVKMVAPAVDPKLLENAGATGFRDILDTALVSVVQQAFAFAVTQAFLLPIIAGCVATPISIAIKGRKLK